MMRIVFKDLINNDCEIPYVIAETITECEKKIDTFAIKANVFENPTTHKWMFSIGCYNRDKNGEYNCTTVGTSPYVFIDSKNNLRDIVLGQLLISLSDRCFINNDLMGYNIYPPIITPRNMVECHTLSNWITYTIEMLECFS